MKVVGIIAEYNPFHNGHEFLTKKAKELTGADYVIVVMSGDFTQRGTPALMDKYLRARMALLNDVDLVIELPVHYANSSAEYFARGAVCLLDKLGVVDSICFGSECGNIEQLTNVARILADEPEIYKQNLKLGLKRGFSYPMARNAALEMSIPDFVHYESVIRTPNNILGIEYIKALLRLNSNIKPYTISRLGSSYHDRRLNTSFSSALAIRQSLMSNNRLDMIKDQVPDNCYELLEENFGKLYPIFPDELTPLLKYRLILEENKGYDQFVDISPDLSDKIKKNLFKVDTFNGFCDLLKSKDLTHARISRCLGHIILNITQKEMDELKQNGFIHYARILGFRSDSDALLGEIKKNSSIPLITKLADASKVLSPEGMKQLEKDITASHIYEMIAASKFHHPVYNEYQRQIIKI